jgi:hypothetical protein
MLQIHQASDEKEFYAKALEYANQLQHRQRDVQAPVKRNEVLAIKIVRAVEDLEKAETLRTMKMSDAQRELRVFGWSAMITIVTYMAAVHSRFAHRLHAEGHHKRASQLAAFAPLLRTLSMRSEKERHRAAKLIWRAWQRVRVRVVRERIDWAVTLVHKFLTQRRETVAFAMAVTKYVRTVRALQSRWRGTLDIRRIREDMCQRQLAKAIQEYREQNASSVQAVRDGLRAQLQEAAARKSLTRLQRAELVNELKRVAEAQAREIQERSAGCGALATRPDIITQLVKNGMKRKSEHYRAQVGRFAKAAAAYDRDTAKLREVNIFVLSHRHRGKAPTPCAGMSSASRAVTTGPPRRCVAERLLLGDPTATRTKTNESANGMIFIDAPTALLTVDGTRPGQAKDEALQSLMKQCGIHAIPIRPVVPFFHSLFAREEVTRMISAGIELCREAS